MAIEFVGYATANAGASAPTYTISLTSLTGGIGTSVQAGDVVVVTSGWAHNADGTPGVSTGDYTNVHSDLYSNDVFDANFIVQYKRMGVTPDSSVSLTGINNGNYASTAVVMVFRGVDPTTPLDGVTPTTATGVNGALADPPSIVPSTAGAWVVHAIGLGLDNDFIASAAPVPASGYTYFATTKRAGLIMGSVAGMAVRTDWVSGTVDEGQWSGYTQDTNCTWAASSFVLKPDPAYTGASQRPVVCVMT